MHGQISQDFHFLFIMHLTHVVRGILSAPLRFLLMAIDERAQEVVVSVTLAGIRSRARASAADSPF